MGIILIAFLIYGTLIIVETHPEKPRGAHVWNSPDFLWFGPLLGGTTIVVLLAIYSALSTGCYANFEFASKAAKISTIICEIVGLPFAIFVFVGWMFSFFLAILVFVFVFAVFGVIAVGLHAEAQTGYSVKEGINRIIQLIEKLIKSKG